MSQVIILNLACFITLTNVAIMCFIPQDICISNKWWVCGS